MDSRHCRCGAVAVRADKMDAPVEYTETGLVPAAAGFGPRAEKTREPAERPCTRLPVRARTVPPADAAARSDGNLQCSMAMVQK